MIITLTRKELLKLWLTEVLAENPDAIGKYKTIEQEFWQDAFELCERVEK